MESQTHLYQIIKLTASYEKNRGEIALFDQLDFAILRGKWNGLVGDSGSGKSTLGRILAGLADSEMQFSDTSEVIYWNKNEQWNLLQLSKNELVKYRKFHASIVFQNGGVMLNPVQKIGKQLMEAYLMRNPTIKDSRKYVTNWLAKVQLTPTYSYIDKYAHQLSGGEQQRVVIAMALMKHPTFLILDEPTSNLDAQLQNDLISLIRELQSELHFTVLLISHDLELVQNACEIVHKLETGKTIQVGKLEKEHYDYIHKNIGQLDHQKLLLKAVDVTFQYSKKNFLRRKKMTSHLPIWNFELYAGQIIGIVGESGSGKSTLAKLILGQVQMDQGKILLDGTNDLQHEWTANRIKMSNKIQYISQNPYLASNPSITIREILEDTNKVSKFINATDLGQMMQRFQLDDGLLDRKPNKLSGGELQRFHVIAALMREPKILICDEIVSSLDHENRKLVLQALLKEQERLQFGMLFISHDRQLIDKISDDVIEI